MSLAIPLSNRGADYIHAAYGGDRLKQNQYSRQAGNDVTRVIVNPIYKGLGYPAAGINTTSFSGPTRLAEITTPTPYDIKKIKRRGKKLAIRKDIKKPYNAATAKTEQDIKIPANQAVEFAIDQPSYHAQVLALNERNEAVKKSFDTMQTRAMQERRPSNTFSQQSKDPSVIRNLAQSPAMITDPIQPAVVTGLSNLVFSPVFEGFVETPSRMTPTTLTRLEPQQSRSMMSSNSSLSTQQPEASTGVARAPVIDVNQDVIDKTMDTQPKTFVSETPFAPQILQVKIPKLKDSKTLKPDLNDLSPELLKAIQAKLKKTPTINKPPPAPKGSRFATDEELKAQTSRLTAVKPSISKPSSSKDNPTVAAMKKSLANRRKYETDAMDLDEEEW